MSLVAGMVVAGRYALERRFASGAWGSLWHAHDEKSQRNCTVRLTGAGVVNLRAMRERFAREVRAANALRCQNVVSVLDHGEWSGMPFVVFESLSGEDLATRLRREGRLPPGQVIEVVTDVARALSRAHALGVIHGDLKPENIFLIRAGSNEVAKVLDFGITGSGPGASLDPAAEVYQPLGEPLYMSPEQARAGHLDFRSDLWSLAAIAVHCLGGRPELPATLDAWREKALSRDPELRFQSAEELADALAHALERVTLTGRPSIHVASARESDDLGDAPLSRQRAHWDFVARPGARKRALRISLVAVFGLLVVTLGVALIRTHPVRTPVAEVSLPPRLEPARSINTTPNVAPAASCAPAQPEAIELSPPPPRASDKTPRARTKRKPGGTLLDHKGEPDYGI
jgi:serine/threonine protein kinase